jgi:putative transposase
LNLVASKFCSAKDECLSKIILFGERSLRRAMKEYVEHYHTERNHQGKGNVLLFQCVTEAPRDNSSRCRERLGGLLRYYYRNAS